MSWLVLLYFIELGFSPYYNSLNVVDNVPDRSFSENTMYVTFDAELVINKYVFVGGAIKTYMKIEDMFNYYPFEANYLFKAGLRYKNIEAGFRHWCGHGVRPWPIAYQPRGSTDGSYEEFYIRLEVKR